MKMLGHYSTSRKVASLLPNEVIGFLNLPNPSGHTMAKGQTQPLREMSTRNLPWGKAWLAYKTISLTEICELIV
jgi:hypothetical protein